MSLHHHTSTPNPATSPPTPPALNLKPQTLLQITGGRNGYGAKLANIFSTKFTVETCDGRRQRRFVQTFSNNMGSKTAPKITACKPSDNWTCITFTPDLAKFDMTVRAWWYGV
jgi:DNA gyrase/topoisomerase IV subunit B